MTEKDVDGSHLRILIEQAEDRIERVRTAQEVAERAKRLNLRPERLNTPDKNG
jgi:hypothetical protein